MFNYEIKGGNMIIKLPPNFDTTKKYTVEIKPISNKRTLTANAYMWTLCQSLAEVLSKNYIHTKEDVYRAAIKACGHFTLMPIREDAAKRFCQIWAAHGTGWLTENMGASKLKGYVIIAAYHGSSSYTSAEMARLIDFLIDECKQLNIPTRAQNEIDEFVKDWGINN